MTWARTFTVVGIGQLQIRTAGMRLDQKDEFDRAGDRPCRHGNRHFVRLAGQSRHDNVQRRRPLPAQMHMAHVLLQPRLAHEGLPAPLLLPVPVGNVLGARGVDLPANKPQTLVRGPDVRVQIRHARQLFVTPLPRTLDRLSLLQHASGVVHVDVPLQLSLAPALDFAEHGVDVLLVQVSCLLSCSLSVRLSSDSTAMRDTNSGDI